MSVREVLEERSLTGSTEISYGLPVPCAGFLKTETENIREEEAKSTSINNITFVVRHHRGLDNLLLRPSDFILVDHRIVGRRVLSAVNVESAFGRLIKIEAESAGEIIPYAIEEKINWGPNTGPTTVVFGKSTEIEYPVG